MGGGAAGGASRQDEVMSARRWDCLGAQLVGLLHTGSLGVWIPAQHVETLARTAAEQGRNILRINYVLTDCAI